MSEVGFCFKQREIMKVDWSGNFDFCRLCLQKRFYYVGKGFLILLNEIVIVEIDFLGLLITFMYNIGYEDVFLDIQ